MNVNSLNNYYQSELANKINTQVTELISLITLTLNIHLNIGQSLTMSSSQSFMSLETISIDSLENKIIQQVGNAQFQMPSNLSFSTSNRSSISLRVCFLSNTDMF